MVIFPLGYKTIWLDDRLHGTVNLQCPAVLSIATASCMIRSIGTARNNAEHWRFGSSSEPDSWKGGYRSPKFPKIPAAIELPAAREMQRHRPSLSQAGVGNCPRGDRHNRKRS
jgi:hypothetical protein